MDAPRKAKPRWKLDKHCLSQWHFKPTDAIIERVSEGNYRLIRRNGSQEYFPSLIEASIEGERL